jgi:hypothetical protein
MAGFSNAAETGIMKLLFQAVAWSLIADNAASTPQTNIAMSLHTADPGDTGTGTTSEASYTSYARVNVARTTGGWTETNGSVTPVAAITFPAATGGSSTVTHAAAGMTGGGATALHMVGTVTPNISVSNPIQPILSTATSFSLD